MSESDENARMRVRMLRVNSADWKIKFSLLSICQGNCVNNSECSETDERANRRFASFPVASSRCGPGSEIFNYENEISRQGRQIIFGFFVFLGTSGPIPREDKQLIVKRHYQNTFERRRNIWSRPPVDVQSRKRCEQ